MLKELNFKKSTNVELRRSNSAGVFYERHNSIYLFGGHFEKQKVGDVLRYDLSEMTVD